MRPGNGRRFGGPFVEVVLHAVHFGVWRLSRQCDAAVECEGRACQCLEVVENSYVHRLKGRASLEQVVVYLTFSGFRKMLPPNVLRDVHPLNMPLIEVAPFAQLNISEPTFSKLVHPWKRNCSC